MGFFDDFRNAVVAYPTQDCQTEIVGFEFIPPTGTVLNVGEKFRFKVRVTNGGHLDMTNVIIQVVGLPLFVPLGGERYAGVSLSLAGPYLRSITLTVPGIIQAHQSYLTVFIYGLAKKITGGRPQDIVAARISAWNASLNDLLVDHSGAGTYEGKLNRQIDPD